mmetsp:Transcript_38495/g.78925  ORF Transcript_38495/g.78925 Transcript_38495/m.78925 type:complete len:134 (-) Transcript_38495:16-417(-)
MGKETLGVLALLGLLGAPGFSICVPYFRLASPFYFVIAPSLLLIDFYSKGKYPFFSFTGALVLIFLPSFIAGICFKTSVVIQIWVFVYFFVFMPTICLIDHSSNQIYPNQDIVWSRKPHARVRSDPSGCWRAG